MCCLTDWCRTEVGDSGHEYHTAESHSWSKMPTHWAMFCQIALCKEPHLLNCISMKRSWTLDSPSLEGKPIYSSNMKQTLWNDESAVHLTLHYKVSDEIFYFMPPSTGHRTELQFFPPNIFMKRSKVPYYLVPTSRPSLKFEWLLYIHLARPIP